MNFFSASANEGHGAFFSQAIHGAALPADAVKVTALRYRELMEGQASGRSIVAGADGRPKFAPVKRATLDELRAAAVKAAKREARRRILAVASLEKQTNDNAEIALAALAGGDASEAIRRRCEIDAIRAASNAIEAVIARMPAANLTGFDAAAAPQWPAQE